MIVLNVLDGVAIQSGTKFIIHNSTLNETPLLSLKSLQHDVVLLNLDDFQDMDIILILKVNNLLVTTMHQ